VNPQLNPVSILLVLLTVCGVTIAGMAGVIKLMLLDRLKDQGLDIKHLMKLRDDDSDKVNSLRVDHTELVGRVETLSGRVDHIERTCERRHDLRLPGGGT